MISMYCGKVEDLLSNFRPNFFDACLCDPPYGLKFMGKSWDHGVPSAAIWEQVKRTLKPGAPILAFGGTRTYHRLACAIEDAGFEIFDSILGAAWIYGQGFPKSLDIGKAIDKAAGAERPVLGLNPNHRPVSGVDYEGIYAGGNTGARNITGPSTPEAHAWNGYGTALKPAWEPVVFARKPLDGTYAENCIEHGCGGLNIDGSRINLRNGETAPHGGTGNRKASPCVSQSGYGVDGASTRSQTPDSGRYPANLILSRHPECDDAGDTGCHPECPVAALDRQSGATKAGSFSRSGGRAKRANPVYGVPNTTRHAPDCYGDGGGASRFFYCAKVSTAERNTGLPPGLRCDHPTLKPIDLCRYLATLILPPARNNHRSLLIPFAGAGSEIIGATIAGWESISAIEKEYPYIEQAWYRIKSRTGIEPIIFD